MPHNPIRVVVGPANYFSHPGSLNHLHDFFTDEQLSRAVWIYGERALAAAQTKLPSAFELPGAKHILFRGHCSESNVQQLAAESGDDRSVVIGVGGGALL
ncbi:iron-containing alcohol dehydrogenase, partial [Escherichia coli]